jgi:hypothetical protein
MYEQFVSSSKLRCPNLGYLSKFLSESTSLGTGRITVLNISSERRFHEQAIFQLDDLSKFLSDINNDKSTAHVLLVEDLTRASINALGSHFDLNPIFFANHLRYPQAGIEGPDGLSSAFPQMLPSIANKAPYFMFEYVQPLGFLRPSHGVPRRLRALSNMLALSVSWKLVLRSVLHMSEDVFLYSK